MDVNYDEIPLLPFSNLSFNHYVMHHWDTHSALSKSARKEKLLRDFVCLGKYRRKDCSHPLDFQRAPTETRSTLLHQPCYAANHAWHGSSIPEGISLDLCLPRERKLDAQLERVFWIRTWYGDGSEPDRATAEVGYKRLLDLVFQDYDDSPFMSKPHTFDDAAEFDFPDAMVKPREVPPFLMKAFSHSPNTLDGEEARLWHGLDGLEETEEDLRTVLLVGIADKEACEKGWLQILRINHRGESLSTRLRFKAARADSKFLCFVNLGVRPFEGGEENDEELYVCKGDGWNYDYWH